MIGTEYVIDALGCDSGALRSLAVMRELCEDALRELDLRVVGEGAWHQFPGPGGVTGLYLLTESHLACHTYPEHELATFNLYCCRARPRWAWEERLRQRLGARLVRVRVMERGSERG